MKSSQGHYLTKALFLELLNYAPEEGTCFTTKEEDYFHEKTGRTFLSFKRCFLECGDPTGYIFSQKYLADWTHWVRLTGAGREIRALIDEARVELEARLRSQAIREMIKQGVSGKSYAATLWLANKGWNVTKGAGRPPKIADSETQKAISREAIDFGNAIRRMKSDDD